MSDRRDALGVPGFGQVREGCRLRSRLPTVRTLLPDDLMRRLSGRAVGPRGAGPRSRWTGRPHPRFGGRAGASWPPFRGDRAILEAYAAASTPAVGAAREPSSTDAPEQPQPWQPEERARLFNMFLELQDDTVPGDDARTAARHASSAMADFPRCSDGVECPDRGADFEVPPIPGPRCSTFAAPGRSTRPLRHVCRTAMARFSASTGSCPVLIRPTDSLARQ